MMADSRFSAIELNNHTSLQFDGVDDGLILNNAEILAHSNFTLSAKLKTTASRSMNIVAQENESHGGYYRVMMNADGSVTFSLGNSSNEQFSITSTQKINDGQHHQIAVQREGRTGLLWIDGKIQAAIKGESVISLGENNITTIGYRDESGYFEGNIQALNISDESLSESTLFGYQAPDETVVGAYRETITAGAESISGQVISGFLASRIAVTGRHSFGLYGNEIKHSDGTTQGDRAVVAAATEWGAGRLVLHGSHRILQADQSTSQYDTGQFLQNAIAWLGRTDDKTMRIVTDNSWSGQMERWLESEGYTNVVRSSSWWNELDQADIYIGSIENSDRSQAVREFVKAGGGLLTGRSWWGGFDGTRQTLDGSGLQLNNAGVGESWINELGSVSTEYAHGIKGLELFQQGNADTISAQKDAAQSLIETYRNLPDGNPLREAIETVALARTESINPTRDNPFRWTEFDRAALKVETEIIKTAAPSEVTQHRNAEPSYGDIPDNAPRVNPTATIDLTQPLTSSKKHSTGIYVPPGEVVSVSLPEQLVDSGAYFQINNHTDSVYARSQLTRFPEGISRRFQIDSTEMEIANAFGGFVYLVIPKEQALGIVNLEFQNTLDAPYFVLGETSDAEWNASIKNNPAPYAEIVTDNLFITLPSDRIRDLDNPTELAMAWEQVELAQDYVRGIENTAFRFEGINVDVQISIGAAHSGYPVQAPQGGWGEALVNLDALLEYGSWGWFHELGHQHQRSYTGTDGDGEHTVNIFSMASNDALGSVPGSPGWGDMWDPARRVQRFESTPGGFREMGVGERLVMNAQLSRTFGWEAYRNIYLTYETDPDNRPRNEQDERDQWLIRWSQETGRDLTPFFDAWQYGHSQTAKDIVAALNLPEWSMIEIFAAETIVTGAPENPVTFDVSSAAWSAAANGSLSFTPTSTITNGELIDLGNGEFQFTPEEGYAGRQTIEFQVTNSDGGQEILVIDLQTVSEAINTNAVDTILASNDVNRDYSERTSLKIDTDTRSLQGLLRFENLIGDGTGQVPEGMEILSASLEYSLDDYGSVVDFHKMLSPWNETDGWSTLGSGIQLNDLEASRTKDFSITQRDFGTHRADVTATVKGWIQNPDSNYGWAIMPTQSDSMEISSAEGSRPPRLLISYAPVGSFTEPVNMVPVTEDMTVSTDEDQIIAIDILANTTDPDADDRNINTVDLWASVVGQPEHGRVHRLPDGKLAFMPNDNFNGRDSFTYQVSDGHDESNISTVNIIVTDTNDSPVTPKDRPSTNQNTEVSFNPLANDIDVDGSIEVNSLSFIHPPNGATLSPDGQTLLVPNQGIYTISPTISTTHTNAVDTILASNDPDQDLSEQEALKIDSARRQQGLLRFEGLIGSEIDQVPAGMEIISATLRYSLDDYGSVVDLHRMLRPWNETDSWKDLGDGIQLNNVDAAQDKEFSIAHRNFNTHSQDVTDTVRDWIANPGSNFGWAIAPTGTDSMKLSSAEGSRPPELVITYASPDTPEGPISITNKNAVDTIVVSDNPEADLSEQPNLQIYASQPNLQGLLRFDQLAGEQDGQIPEGMILTSATLEYSLDDYGSVVDVHQLLIPWNDTNSWSDFNDGVALDGMEASSLKDFSISHRDRNTHTQDVTETVQGWLADPDSNHGWAFISTGTDSIQISSAEGDRPPRLHLSYAPVDAVGTGNITFKPDAQFTGEATPVFYEVSDNEGANSIGEILVSVESNEVIPIEESLEFSLDSFHKSDTAATYAVDESNTLSITGSVRQDWVMLREIDNNLRITTVYQTSDAQEHSPQSRLTKDLPLSSIAGEIKIHTRSGNNRVNASYLHQSTSIQGGDSLDLLTGGKGNDTIWGGAGGDRLEGKAGNDLISGGNHDDSIRGGQGSDSLDGGAGIDVLDYMDSEQGVTVNLFSQTAFGGDAQGDTIANFERVYGSQSGDQLTGSHENNLLFGQGGDDRLAGGAGNDLIRGGEGADTLDGGSGKADALDYRSSATGVKIDLFRNSVRGGDAEGDQISNFERVYGSQQSDLLTGTKDNNLLSGYAGDDTLLGLTGNDRLLGFSGNDRIRGGKGADFLDGGEGNADIIDYLHSFGGVTVDLLNNTAIGGEANGDAIANFERAYGSQYHDRLTGSNDNNFLYGANGNDTLFGGNGNDLIRGGKGADQLTGGSGANVFYINDLTESLLDKYDRITDFKVGIDRINGPSSITTGQILQLASINSMDQTELSAILNPIDFEANEAAVFSYSKQGLSERKFLAINNNVAGFQPETDAVIEITGFMGSVDNLSIF